MYIEINCADKDESIKRYLLEHNLNELINHAIDKFHIPLNCFIGTHETPGGNTREILHIEAENENSLIFYINAIISYYGSTIIDFIQLYLRECDGIIECIAYDKDGSNKVNITTAMLNDCLRKNIFN